MRPQLNQGVAGITRSTNLEKRESSRPRVAITRRDELDVTVTYHARSPTSKRLQYQ
jgi:hypothetical protein